MDLDQLPLEDRPFQLDEHGPVFILGCPRSGTTFLSHCVGALSGCREFVGVIAPPRIMHLVACSSSDVARERLMLCIRDIFWQTFWRSEYFKKNKLAFVLEGKISWRNLVKRPGMQDLLFCYKEPFLCFAVEHFASHFPHSRFIHIIRDGRDNADSMSRTYGDALSDEVLKSEPLSLNKVSEIGFYERVDGFNYPYWIKADERPDFRGLSTYGRYVRLWREMTERALGLRSLVPTNRYLELRYEDVVRNPSIEGTRIKDFLGRPASSGFSRALDRAFSTSIGLAGKNQDAEKLQQATNIAGPLLESLGYEC